jgi:hypothetical protein
MAGHLPHGITQADIDAHLDGSIHDEINAIEAEVCKVLQVMDALVAALQECEEYFDDRADADCDQDGFIPNKEMRLLTEVREALAQAGVK